jgi:hypothetical protein
MSRWSSSGRSDTPCSETAAHHPKEVAKATTSGWACCRAASKTHARSNVRNCGAPLDDTHPEQALAIKCARRLATRTAPHRKHDECEGAVSSWWSCQRSNLAAAAGASTSGACAGAGFGEKMSAIIPRLLRTRCPVAKRLQELRHGAAGASNRRPTTGGGKQVACNTKPPALTALELMVATRRARCAAASSGKRGQIAAPSFRAKAPCVPCGRTQHNALPGICLAEPAQRAGPVGNTWRGPAAQSLQARSAVLVPWLWCAWAGAIRACGRGTRRLAETAASCTLEITACRMDACTVACCRAAGVPGAGNGDLARADAALSATSLPYHGHPGNLADTPLPPRGGP